MKLSLHLTDACDLSCSYCFRRVPETPGRMDLATARRALELALARPEREHAVEFVGGEPLLEGELIRTLVREARRLPARFHFSLITNGLRLDGNVLAFARREGVAVALSHDGTRAAHDRHRRGPGGGSWQEATAALERLLAVDPLAATLTTVSPDTAGEMAAGLAELGGRGARRPGVAFELSARWDEPALAALDDSCTALEEEIAARFRAGDDWRLNLFEDRVRAMIDGRGLGGRCALGEATLCVAPDGSLYPCTAFVHRPEFHLGDVERGLRPLAQRPAPGPRATPPAGCPTCPAEGLCPLDCACQRLLGSGPSLAVPAAFCEIERRVAPAMVRAARRLYDEGNGLFLRRFYG